MKKRSSGTRTETWKSGKTIVKVGQSASASINQGGNAISINATDIGVVRIRPQ